MTVHARKFKKSSFSPFKWTLPGCVSVSISDSDVLVSDTKNPKLILRFTIPEWSAFIRGVKNAEFDVNLEPRDR